MHSRQYAGTFELVLTFHFKAASKETQSQTDMSGFEATLSQNTNSCCGPNMVIIYFEHLKDIQLKGGGGAQILCLSQLPL